MRVTLVFLVMSVIITARCYASELLALDEAVATALKNHPLIIEAKENILGAEARSRQSLANYYPQISIVSDWSRGQSYVAALGNSKL